MINHSNPFVSYLNRYTTVSPEHEAAFDEFISQASAPFGKQLRLETNIEKFLNKCFKLAHPPSIILTGNAGDGKTYLCRQIIKLFTGNEVTEWNDQVEWPLEKDDLELIVIKDLSEVGEASGAQILKRLASSLSEEKSNSIFLIAANEGRLRALLSQEDELIAVRDKVNRQLKNGPDKSNSQLIVLDLNQVTTSAYVPQALDWLTDISHWNECQDCPAFKSCPILFNATQLRDPQIVNRLKLLYQILEHLGIHVTIRDMLIHLAYTATGGLNCEAVIEQNRQLGSDFHKYAYFENVWGEMVDEASRRRISVAYNLQHFNVGRQSLFEVDNFIINGSSYDGEIKEEYDSLFSPSVDLGDRRFSQDRNSYLRGGTTSPKNEDNHPLLKWLPHCRRKLFFEWKNVQKAEQLIPFLFLPKYLNLLGGDAIFLDQARRQLVIGLNRAFSRLYLTSSDSLYVTSQYARAVEQPVPLVKVELPLACIKLKSQSIADETFDCTRQEIILNILPPPGFQNGHEVHWNVDLLRFEYLMRLAQGGTYNVLNAECDLAIRQLKNQLLTRFNQSDDAPGSLSFFSIDRYHYQLRKLQVDQDGKVQMYK